MLRPRDLERISGILLVLRDINSVSRMMMLFRNSDFSFFFLNELFNFVVSCVLVALLHLNWEVKHITFIKNGCEVGQKIIQNFVGWIFIK